MITEYRKVATADTNSAVIKNTEGQVLGALIAATADVTVHLYDKATAPTVGTDTPVLTFRVKAGDTQLVDFTKIHRDGIPFDLGIGIGAVKGATLAANDATVLAAGDAVMTIFYR